MNIREIDEFEIYKLLPCISELSEYHNQVSVNFKGFYPSRPYEITLDAFSSSVKSGISHITVVENSEQIIGFCKIDINHENGKLDYLVILQEYRGKGYGSELMDWAMNTFRKNKVKHVEVKVVDGNDAIHLYEKYGFKINAHLLWYNKE